LTEIDNGRLLAAAADGDQRSWEILVNHYAHLVWTVARSFRLDRADAADVSQTTWLKLVEHLRDIREPERLGSWLVTTARREALALVRQSGRTVPTGEAWRLDWPDLTAEPPDGRAVRSDDAAAVRRAFRRLPVNCQQLLHVMLADPAPTYAEIGAALGMPVGSIGPTRARCLANLGRLLAGEDHRDG
jgi:RNA polymerase sigma factor (sigma-70 family)